MNKYYRSQEKPEKVGLVTNSYAPYRVPLYNRLAEHFGHDNFKVFWCESMGKNRYWRLDKEEMHFRYAFLSSIRIGKHYFNTKLWYELGVFQPYIIIVTGYSRVKDYLTLIWGLRHRCRIVFWFGCHHSEFQTQNTLIWKVKRWYLTRCDSFVTYGTYAAERLKCLGMNPDVITTGCNVGRVSEFRKRTPYFADSMKERNGAVEILTVAQLTKRKGIDHLIRAMESLKEFDWRLRIIGEGEEKEELQKLVIHCNLQDQIEFLGYRQKEELFYYYGSSDIFVLPSLSDPFGIVVSESLASGLFTIVSKYELASYDLIKNGINGFSVDPNKQTELSKAIKNSIAAVKSGNVNKRDISRSVLEFDEDYYTRRIIEAVSVRA